MNLTMEQVREMDNTALRVLVAQLLGWTEIYEQYSEWEEERAFDYHGVPPSTDDRTLLPDWPEDLNDAVWLVTGLEWTLGPDRYKGEIACSIEWGANLEYGREHAVEEFSPTPVRAVTLAWIAWKLAQKE
jgi:hypothetical protein